MSVSIDLDEEHAIAGQPLRGRVRVTSPHARSVKARLTLTCEAHGWADEESEERARVELGPIDLRPREWGALPFAIDMPSMVSYDGSLVSVRWVLRAETNLPVDEAPKERRDVQVIAPIRATAASPTGAPERRALRSGLGLRVVGASTAVAATLLAWALMAKSRQAGDAIKVVVLTLFGFGLFATVAGLIAIMHWLSTKGLARLRFALASAEVSSDVYAGDPVRVRLHLARWLGVTQLEVRLIGDECAVRGSGSSSEVRHAALHRAEQILDGSGLAREVTVDFQLPPDAAASFKIGGNGVTWFVEVRARMRSWPDWSQTFPVKVLPSRRAG